MVAAAIVGSAVVGGVVSSANANKATGAQREIAGQASDVAREELDWAKFQYNDTKDEREAAYADARAVTAAQLATMTQQNALAQDYATYNKETFRPLEQKMVGDATAFDTPERRAAEAAKAVTDVNIARGQQRQATDANLASYGVAPDSMKSRALQSSSDVNTARVAAGAAGAARDKVEATGWARMADAVSLGRGLPSAQATAVQTGTSAGSAATGAAGFGLSALNSGNQVMQAGYQGATNAYGVAGNLYNQAAKIQTDAFSQGAGMGMDLYKLYAASDEKVKKGTGKPANTASMLEAVEKTTVDEGWTYDPAKGGPDDGGEPHIGPMAQDVRRTMGERAAPGGKALDLVTMNGVTMAAVQELSKRIKKLEARKAA